MKFFVVILAMLSVMASAVPANASVCSHPKPQSHAWVADAEHHHCAP